MDSKKFEAVKELIQSGSKEARKPSHSSEYNRDLKATKKKIQKTVEEQIKDYLISEELCEDENSAKTMIPHMSQSWIESILN